MQQRLLQRFLRYFVRGLLLVIPFALTLYVITTALAKLDRILPFKIPGLGLTIIILSITLIGYLGSHLFVKTTIETMDRFFLRLPLISPLYAAFKEITSALSGKKKKFDKPVLVTMNPPSGIQRLGFITQTSLAGVGMEGHVAVYVPHSYAFSGNVHLVPQQQVTPLPISSAEVMKFIVSGGVTMLALPPSSHNKPKTTSR